MNRLVLHVGLPKTGTSALQTWAWSHREWLRERGVIYPEPANAAEAPNHKHQFLVSLLRSGRGDQAAAALRIAPNATVLASTEGLTSHLLDFPDDSLAAFRKGFKGMQITVVCVVREARGWLRSYWKQALINPNSADPRYGTNLPAEGLGRMESVAFMMDATTLRERLVHAFGTDDVVMLDYADRWVDQILALAGVERDQRAHPPGRLNVSVSDDAAEVIRQINGSAPDPVARATALHLLALSTPTTSQLRNSFLLRGSQAADVMSGRVQWPPPWLERLSPTTPEQHRLVASLLVRPRCVAQLS